ncbi:MAG: hypothetical protein IJP31_01130 [Lachnospiraceae bacterium]|nr:hypothetical protein [Lachnospiraceae bacterium]
MKQYEMYFTNEYTEEIIDELTEIFKIKYDKSLLHQAINEKDKSSINNIFIINIDENRIIVDCNNRDWIYSLIVISTDCFADFVSEIMMRWDNEIREEYGQELVLCEQDVFGKSNTLLERIEEYYKQKIY